MPCDWLNLSTSLSTYLTIVVNNGSTDSPSLICKVSNDPLRPSTAPFKLLSFSAATCAAVTLLISACILFAPSAPSFIAIVAARTASVPNIVFRACCCCCSVKPLKLLFKTWEISANDFTLPSAVKNWFAPSAVMIPSSLIIFVCALVCGCKFINIVLRDVPASEPLRPFCANTAKALVVSLKESPSPLATGATAESPYFNSCTSVADAFAAPAN